VSLSRPLVEVVRSGFAESVHRGSLVALNAAGAVALRVGDPDRVILPRSTNKPLQAAGMLEAGLALEGELLALAAASHSGEPHHLAGVERILLAAALPASALGCPPDLPADPTERERWLRAGRAPEPLAMNCSGKHAAMLATCVVRGWPPATYRDPEHPLQMFLRARVEELAGERVGVLAVDGCGAPVFGLSLTGLARAIQALVTGEDTSGRAVADAMRAHPDYVGGTGRDVTRLMRGVPGLLAKDGAEGVYVAAAADGTTVAVKVEDGSSRAAVPALVAALHALGMSAPVLDELAESPVLGGGRPVGVVRAIPGLFGP